MMSSDRPILELRRKGVQRSVQEKGLTPKHKPDCILGLWVMGKIRRKSKTSGPPSPTTYQQLKSLIQ
jgi:hypothetical protein